MKAIATLIFVLFIGLSAQAQDAKAATSTIGIANASEQATTVGETSVARLYKFKNSRIKKELTFTTKRNAAKLV